MFYQNNNQPEREANAPKQGERLRFVEQFADWNQESTIPFNEVVKRALEILPNAAPLLANTFKVSESAVMRWASGKSAPMLMIQDEVVKRMCALVKGCG